MDGFAAWRHHWPAMFLSQGSFCQLWKITVPPLAGNGVPCSDARPHIAYNISAWAISATLPPEHFPQAISAFMWESTYENIDVSH
jgi:hypothetical protein